MAKAVGRARSADLAHGKWSASRLLTLRMVSEKEYYGNCDDRKGGGGGGSDRGVPYSSDDEKREGQKSEVVLVLISGICSVFIFSFLCFYST